MKRMIALIISLVLQTANSNIATGLATQSPEPDVDLLTQRLQTQLDEIVKNEKLPGVTLAVVLPDQQLIELASGFSDKQASIEMKPRDRMLGGSTGKTFVSAIALQLVSEGKLELDRLASQYLTSDSDRAWFAKLPNANTITIRSLMNHTSGLPRYLFQPECLEDFKKHPLKHRSPQQGLSFLHGVTATNAVGKGWSYSDANYLVLGLIIEKVTGREFYGLARERLLEPLHLSDTIPSNQPKIEGLIPGQVGSVNFFDLPGKTVVDGAYVMNPDFEWCGGGFATNSGDLAKWLQSLHSGRVLDETRYRHLVTPVDLQTGRPAEHGYGLGSFIWKTDLGIFYGHAGIMPGYLTQIEYSREYKFAIALQTNSDQGLGRRQHSLVQRLAAIVIEEIKRQNATKQVIRISSEKASKRQQSSS